MNFNKMILSIYNLHLRLRIFSKMNRNLIIKIKYLFNISILNLLYLYLLIY
jgi:hypothetical protein